MRVVARRIVDFITIGLLIGLALALVDADNRPLEYLCLETDSAFYAGQCPGTEDAQERDEVLIVDEDTTLTADRRGPITIGADGVTLDCADHQLVGDGPAGIRSAGRRNVTIKNCSVIGFMVGIELQTTFESTVLANRVEAARVGYVLSDSDGNELRGNSSSLNRTDFTLERADENLLSANSIDRGPGIIWVTTSSDNMFAGNELGTRSHVRLEDGTDNVIAGNTLLDGGDITVSGSANALTDNEMRRETRIQIGGDANTFSGNRLEGFIYLDGTGHTVTDNEIDSTSEPLEPGSAGMIIRSSDSVISSNLVSGAGLAFSFRGANRNTVTDNRAAGGATGFRIETSKGNVLEGNDASTTGQGLDGLAATVHNVFTDNVGFNITPPLAVAADLTLQADYEGTIVIAADGIKLDCAGHTILPTGWSERNQPNRHEVAIQIVGRRAVTIENCQVAGYARGISLWKADGNVVRDNTAVIHLGGSDDNTVSGNSANIALNRSHGNTISGNVGSTINLEKSQRNTLDGNSVTGGPLSVSGRRNVVTSNTVSGDLVVRKAIKSTVADNGVTDGQLRLVSSSENTLRGNTVATDRGVAFVIGQVAANNIIDGNVARDAKIGFRVYNSADNTISRNRAINNEIGFKLQDARNNTFSNNDASAAEVGVDIGRSDAGSNTFNDNIGF